jgi:hypothetical protein
MSNYCIHRDLLCRIGIDTKSNQHVQHKQMCTAQNGIFHPNLNDSDIEKYDAYPKCLEDNAPFVIKDNSTNHSYLDDKILVDSIKKDDITTFMSLLKDNPNRNMREQLNYGYDGNTILHEAIYWNANTILNFLLKNVCSETLKAKNIDQNTILHLATLKQLDWVVHLLQKNYPNVNIQNNVNVKGDTPFLSAIRTGSETLVKLYLNSCDPYQLLSDRNSVSKYNALHVAVTTPNKNLNIIKMLAKHGVDMIDKCESNEEGSLMETTTVSPCEKPKNSILEDLEKQPRTPLHLEIQTYLIREFYKLYTNNNSSGQAEYHIAIQEHPEYSAFEKNCKTNVDINIEYDRTLNDKDLYRPMDQTALKVLPKQLRQDFLKNNSI